MEHQYIEDNDIVDAYLLNRLSDDEKRSFEEHLFACDHCFEAVRLSESFISNVRRSSEEGILSHKEPESLSFFSGGWRLAFVFASCCLVLTSTAVFWYALILVPRLKNELVSERRKQEDVARQAEKEIGQLKEVVGKARADATPGPPERKPETLQIQPNIPVFVLENNRDLRDENKFSIPAGSSSVILWMETGGSDEFKSFRLELVSEGKVFRKIEGLKRNGYGAVSVALSVDLFPSGPVVARLLGSKAQSYTLAAEFPFTLLNGRDGKKSGAVSR